METVKGNHRFGEAGTDNLVHTVGEVKCHFLNQQADGFRHLLQDACNLLCLSPLHNGHEASLSSMSLLVGQDGIDLTSRQTRLVYAQMSAHILRDYYPVLCMFCIFPGLETTDGLLVECEELTDLDDKRELETVLQTAGLSMQEFSVIKEKMHKAGVIGIEIGKNLFPYLEPGKSVLLFRWHGVNRYQFTLYDHPMTEEKKHEVLSLFQHVLYNDSVVFESFGGYPGMRGFPDRDHFLANHGFKVETSGAAGQ